MTAKKLNRRQARWSLYLARFDFKLTYRLGRCMGKPDMLSWRLDHSKGASDNENMVLLRPELLAIRALKGVQMEGPERDILREIHQGDQRGDQEELVVKVARELRQAASKTVHFAEWSEEEGLLRFRGRIYVPRNADLQR